MKQGWEIRRLGEVCDFQGGAQPAKSQFIYEPKEGYVRFLQIRDFTSDKNTTYIPESKKNRYCNVDDILLGRYGASVGKVLVNKAGAYNVAIIKTLPNESILFKRYFYYYLNTEEFQFSLLNTASRSAQDGFGKNDVFDFPILVPPLAEQQRIVSILDEAFAAIDQAKANTERNLKNAKELFDSYLQEVFEMRGGDWKELRIDELCKLINGRAYKKDELLQKGRYRVLRVGNFFTSDQWYYSDLELDDAKYCEKEDLLYAWSASFGPRVWKEEKVIYHYHIWKVIPNLELVTKEFLYTIFEWDKEKIKAAQGTGTTMIHVSKGSMENRIVPVPPIEVQANIVGRLDALRAETSRLAAVYQKKLSDLDELKKSILQKAFVGELTTT